MTALLSFSHSLTPSRDAAKCGKEMHKGSFLPQGNGGGVLALVGQDSILSSFFSLPFPILFLPLDSFLHRGKFNTATGAISLAAPTLHPSSISRFSTDEQNRSQHHLLVVRRG